MKSVPGCLVTMEPILIGSPVAFWPLPRPHFNSPPVLAVVDAPVLAVVDAPVLAVVDAAVLADVAAVVPDWLSLPPHAASAALAASSAIAVTAHRTQT
ncbi:hypothetical protein [Capillimicrobium parvum]|uniref:hypothetical protein n=1 Tax=Capillimicrobium parvum TaxID=2884022 RepID=UPI00216AD08C|nr:hypothetical protein [Capillimicrobium parvum]